MSTPLPAVPVQPGQDSQDTLLAEKLSKPALGDAVSKTSSSKSSSFVDALEEAEAPAPAPKAPTPAPASPPGPVTTPFPHPLPECKPVPQAELTADQQKKYEELLAQVHTWTEIATTNSWRPTKEELNDEDRVWLTRECLLRYLRATSWDVNQASKRLQATLTWQREYGMRAWTPDYISPENETGKQVILGYDNDARPCLYLNPSKQNTPKSDRQLHHLVFMLERVIDLMAPGQESTALLINFKDTGGSGPAGPSVGQGKQTLNILQGHYPERLGRALISELPWYITTFFKLISPFIDPVTKSKMKFNEPLTQHVPPSQLLTHYGGNVEFEYKHDLYWPALVSLAQRRQRDYRGRWEKAGKKIGEHEAFLRGGDVNSADGTLTGSDLPEGFMEGASV